MADGMEHPAGKEAPVPGTVHIVDLLGTMRGQHAEGGQKDIVLVPAPSTDPDDPLNWSPRRKALSTACICVYTLMVGIASAGIYSVLEPISEDTGLTLNDLNQGTGYMFLFFGWGCLVWQPLALQYGKRPIFVGAPIESLCEISVTDIYFSHERGRYIGLYALLLAGSNFFAPIISGFINDGQGWQWVLYWCAIFCGIGFVFPFFFMEETNYVRHTAGIPASTPGVIAPAEPANPEKCTPTEASVNFSPPLTSYKRKTYLDKIKLFQAADLQNPNELKGMVCRPLIFLTFPVIFYSGFSYGSNLVWFNVLNATASLILSGTYNFSASMVGVAYVSPLIGVAIGSAYTGWFGDWFVIRKARKNKGILESEDRLWLFAPSFLLIPFGLILWGVGAAHHVHWFGAVFAMCILALTNTMGLQLSIAYCIDSYRALSGEAIITVILIRNTMSFAIGYGITPWVTDMGLQNCFLNAAFVGMAQVTTVAIMIKWGKTLRRKSISRYGANVEEMAKSGMVH
ncbi:MFS general substrate transporter [Lindgomyces ingoldianus]|uniref:MFS general substrate transporter n=1 Tax=Lindgomyces ingoldianus TaxID=673940 RepID=A0ACB6R6G4_9PLEO|nr:MFS general substrate transporter [Lindgomyces ingoldianus]KAF2474854.1 MFS general substrate transporter [Lindgomyces ingoldianus]